MIVRMLWPLLAGLLTASIFLGMGLLIAPEDIGATTPEPVPSVSITRVERDETSQEKQRNRPDKPEPKELPPPPPPSSQPRPALADDSGVTLVFPSPDGVDTSITTGAPSDRQATPVVRIPPQYPHRALTRDQEGWVLVEFTITIGGTVADARVVEAEPPRIFNRAALRAIERWKYQPKVVDGKPVAQTNMRQLIEFVIEDR